MNRKLIIHPIHLERRWLNCSNAAKLSVALAISSLSLSLSNINIGKLIIGGDGFVDKAAHGKSIV